MNEDIKTYAKSNNVRLWQVAEALGIPEGMLSRKFRHELDSDSKLEIKRQIDLIAKNQNPQ